MVNIQSLNTTKTASGESLLHSVILCHLWRRLVQDQPAVNYSWQEETAFLYKIGLGMEEVIRYLLQDRPSLLAFETWIIEHELGFSDAAGLLLFLDSKNMEPTVAQATVFSKEEMEFWEKNGYIVLKNAVSKDQANKAVEAIWQYLGASLHDPSTWHIPHPERWGIMLNFVHHAALRENRNSERIRMAFCQLYGTSELELVVDKLGYNPPNDALNPFKGSALHWDTSLQLPITKNLQGVLYLTDTASNHGAFHCVPGFHLVIEDWLAGLPTGTNPRSHALKTLKPIPVPGEAGDLVIWKAALPHCATPNSGLTPRMVQYITYLPKQREPEKAWI